MRWLLPSEPRAHCLPGALFATLLLTPVIMCGLGRGGAHPLSILLDPCSLVCSFSPHLKTSGQRGFKDLGAAIPGVERFLVQPPSFEVKEEISSLPWQKRRLAKETRVLVLRGGPWLWSGLGSRYHSPSALQTLVIFWASSSYLSPVLLLTTGGIIQVEIEPQRAFYKENIKASSWVKTAALTSLSSPTLFFEQTSCDISRLSPDLFSCGPYGSILQKRQQHQQFQCFNL